MEKERERVMTTFSHHHNYPLKLRVIFTSYFMSVLKNMEIIIKTFNESNFNRLLERGLITIQV